MEPRETAVVVREAAVRARVAAEMAVVVRAREAEAKATAATKAESWVMVAPTVGEGERAGARAALGVR